jgi:Ca-activated chloride channel homolog
MVPRSAGFFQGNMKRLLSRSTVTALAAILLLMTTWGQTQTPTQSQTPPKTDPQDPQRQEVIKVETALVTVPVIVTDRFNRFISGLNQKDFKLLEDGQPQEITQFSSQETPFNVALLLDTSRSTIRQLGNIRDAARKFVRQLQPSDRVMIVTFDDRVHFHNEITSSRDEVEQALKTIKTGYMTSLYDAVTRTVIEKLAPIEGRKAIVVLTDGVDTASKLASAQSTLELVSNTGVITYAIQYETRNEGAPLMKPTSLPPYSGKPFTGGLGFVQQGQAAPPQQRDRYLIASDFLKSLAAYSGARYLRAETMEGTTFAFALIANEIRHQYTLSYYSSNAKRDGSYRKIDVSVTQGNDLVVHARQGYRTPKS